MSVIAQIDQWLEIARQLNYQIRYDYFGGTGGGVCEVAGNKWLFMDLALTSIEQLDQLQTAVRNDPLFGTLESQGNLRATPINKAA